MKNQQEQKQKPIYIEELKRFPFKDFDELKKLVSEGVASLGSNRNTALQWIQNGIYTCRRERAQASFMASLIIIVPIGLIIYIVVTQSWLLLLALPLQFIIFLFFHPGQKMKLRPTQNGLILLSLCGLVWSFINVMNWLSALIISFLLVWYSQRALFLIANRGIIRAALEHEDLFCALWNLNGVYVIMYNGDSYWSTMKTEGDKTTDYESGNVFKD